MEISIDGGYVSADSHVIESPDLYELFATRMDKRFPGKAPRVESRPDGDYYVWDGVPAFGVGVSGEGGVIDTKADGKPIETIHAQRHADTRPGAWDPMARLKDQDLDHVRAEVVYPGLLGMWGYIAPDPEYHREFVRVYNDWLGEFCANAPDRLLGAGIVPMRGPIEWALEEAERIAAKGMRSLVLPIEMPGGWARWPDAERFWTGLQELGLPIAFHVGSQFEADEMLEETTRRDTDLETETSGGRDAVALIEQKVCQAARGVSDLIWAGVPQAFPGLRFVIAECGIGWIASILRLNDHWWEDHHLWMEPRLEEPPSFYFHRQFWATFEDDRAGLLTREMLNVDHLMWGSDYPHTEGVFPFSRERISKDFADIPEEETRKMVGGNAAALYGLS